ncbi:MAG: EAL domain-containing protein [Pseudomonadota bacterium]
MSLPFRLRHLIRLCAALLCAAATAAVAAPPSSIKVVTDDNYPPYIFRGADGQLKGILKDTWDLWEKRTGIAVELIGTSWIEAQNIMRSGQADVIETMFETDERKKLYDFSRPYAAIEVAIFFDSSISGITDAASLEGFTLGVKDGDACIEYLNNHGIVDLKRYPSYEALVKAAIRHEIRLLCIDKPPAIHLLNREGAIDAFRYSPALYVGQFHWAVARGNDELKRVIEDGFARITAAERGDIELRWVGARLANDWWPAVSRYALPALGGVGLLIALLAVWSWMLQRRVTARTGELNATLASLRETEIRFRTLFEQANDAIFIMRGPEVIDCNRRAETLYQLPRDKIVSTTPVSAAPENQPDGKPSAEVLAGMIGAAESGRPMVFEWRNQLRDGTLLDVEVSLNRVDSGGEPRLQAIVRDITERKQAEAEIQRLAYFDPLTQLPNRRLLQERLRQALAAASRRHSTGAVLFIDLDNFKTLNDTRGHDLGDMLLTEVGRRLRASVRTEDFIARLGGDEFVVLLEDLHGSPSEAAAQAEAVGQKILEAIGQPFHLGAHEHHTTTSVGVCLFDGARESVEEILKRADAAMYRAKTAGRDTLRFFDPAMQASLESRALLETELRRALPQQQFELFYQPQVDREQRIVGAEALLRWRHPERGLVAPTQFIPLAEDTGLIVPIGQWVLETACQQLQAWNARAGLETFRVSINVSARQFRQENFVPMVRDVVAGSGIDPRRLSFELTESLVLDNVADSIEKMHALKQLGIGFAMDDFGTGYSSLAYLKRLPLDELKIDQSFVRDIATDPGDEVIVRTIIAMANNLGLSVVAEGVETATQRDFLLGHACDLFQGYFFGRPQPVAEFERLLAAPS